MPVALRVIPCLDVHDGRVVKGVNFQNLRDAGDPVELAARYSAQGADELTFLDISASLDPDLLEGSFFPQCDQVAPDLIRFHNIRNQHQTSL